MLESLPHVTATLNGLGHSFPVHRAAGQSRIFLETKLGAGALVEPEVVGALIVAVYVILAS